MSLTGRTRHRLFTPGWFGKPVLVLQVEELRIMTDPVYIDTAEYTLWRDATIEDISAAGSNSK